MKNKALICFILYAVKQSDTEFTHDAILQMWIFYKSFFIVVVVLKEKKNKWIFYREMYNYSIL